MTTFSQVIDELREELVRPDMTNFLVAYLNQTIRDMQFDSQTNRAVKYAENRKEEILTVTGVATPADAFVWELPNLALFQGMDAAYYDRVRRYAVSRAPSVAKLESLSDPLRAFYWYRTGPAIAFAGAGGNGNTIRLSWFEYLPTLTYYADPKNRPVVYDYETGLYMINTEYTPALTPEEKMLRSTNWLLSRHVDTLKEGTRAKAYKRMDDANRGRLAYSQFESMRMQVINAESIDTTPEYTR